LAMTKRGGKYRVNRTKGLLPLRNILEQKKKKGGKQNAKKWGEGTFKVETVASSDFLKRREEGERIKRGGRKKIMKKAQIQRDEKRS